LLDFTTVRLGGAMPVVLVVGGIQSDELWGFSTATLLATRYGVENGSLKLVVPNLNFPSIIRRSRGVNGDMNRKFDALDSSGPDFPTVRRIQDSYAILMWRWCSTCTMATASTAKLM
jgi:predicted deacylase